MHTLEAVIAILLLLSLIYFLTPKQVTQETKPEQIDQAYSVIFSEVSVNHTFRDCLIKKITSEGEINNPGSGYTSVSPLQDKCISDSNINNFIKTQTPYGYAYLAEVCKTAGSCLKGNLPIDQSIYADSILLASEESKIFRLYFWQE